MKRSPLLLALLTAATTAAQTPQPGFARERPCLTAAEAKALATFVLPGLVDGLAERCRGSLPREAYLRGAPASALSDRLRREAAPHWPLARASIEKLNGEKLPTLFGDRLVRIMAEGIAADLTLKEFERADCAAASELVGGLAPLPSANFAAVVSALIALGADEKDGPIRICPTRPVAAK